METWTKRRGANGLLAAGCALDAAHARDDEAPRVLIVDDDASVCAVNLETEGLRVLEAAGGLDVLEPAWCERPNLVFTDVMVSSLDGSEPCRAVAPGRANPWDPGDRSERRGRAGARGAALMAEQTGPSELIATVANSSLADPR